MSRDGRARGLPDDLAADRDEALTVPCRRPPGCGAPAGEPCTRRDADGVTRPLVHLPAHPVRLADAGVVHAPLQPRPEPQPDPTRSLW